MTAHHLGLSSRPASGDGGRVITQAGSRDAGTQYYPHAVTFSPATSSLPANSRALQSASFIPLPSGSIASSVTSLKSLNLAQALIDGLCVVFGFFFFAALFGSLPLAVALMILGVF